MHGKNVVLSTKKRGFSLHSPIISNDYLGPTPKYYKILLAIVAEKFAVFDLRLALLVDVEADGAE
jgi:hypothetical protein